jgi:hypothetical protein
MEPFYGKPVWDSVESIFFMQQSQAIDLPLALVGRSISSKHEGQEKPQALQNLMAMIEAAALEKALPKAGVRMGQPSPRV